MNIQLYMSYAEEWTPEYYGHVNTYMAHISSEGILLVLSLSWLSNCRISYIITLIICETDALW